VPARSSIPKRLGLTGRKRKEKGHRKKGVAGERHKIIQVARGGDRETRKKTIQWKNLKSGGGKSWSGPLGKKRVVSGIGGKVQSNNILGKKRAYRDLGDRGGPSQIQKTRVVGKEGGVGGPRIAKLTKKEPAGPRPKTREKRGFGYLRMRRKSSCKGPINPRLKKESFSWDARSVAIKGRKGRGLGKKAKKKGQKGRNGQVRDLQGGTDGKERGQGGRTKRE